METEKSRWSFSKHVFSDMMKQVLRTIRYVPAKTSVSLEI